MKRIIPLIALLFVIGCASQSKLLYNSLATVQTVTTGAFRGYLGLAINGTIRTNSIPEISRDYNSFQALWSAAVAVAQFNTNTIAPEPVVAASSNLLYKINVAKITP
jgi:hypothetical protein